MIKNQKRAVVALCVIFGGLIFFNLAKKIFFHFFFANYQPPAVTVSTTTVAAKTWRPEIHTVGLFKAVKGVDITAQAAGKITAIHFESGQYVDQDQPLIDIDDSVEQANLKANQAELALQTVNYKRQKDLQTKHATADVNVDEAEAKLLEARAKVEETEALIRQKHIRAPFSGQLGLRQINLGEYVTPGNTVIVTLQALDPLFVEFYLPEQLLTDVNAGQTIIASLSQYPALLFKGTITAVNAKADIDTHNIKVQATFPNCSRKSLIRPKESSDLTAEQPPQSSNLYIECNTVLNNQSHLTAYAFIPGMFASMIITRPPQEKTLVLPSTAISYSLYGNSVFVIERHQDKKGKESLTVKQVFVKTGASEDNETVIIEGLKEGQEVVSSGELKLQNGTRVVINNDIQLHTSPRQMIGE
jgi:membrane fusion protein, multidrug efflux system